MLLDQKRKSTLLLASQGLMLIALLWPGVTLNGEEIRPKFNNVSRRELPRPGYSCYARGQIEFQLMQQRSLVPSEPLTWARTHGKRGLQARFKSSRFEDDAQSHWNVTDLLVTVTRHQKTSWETYVILFPSSHSNWSLYYCTLYIIRHPFTIPCATLALSVLHTDVYRITA